MTNYYATHSQYQVYILELEGGFYYVGISTDPDFRLEQHEGVHGGGAEFTALHKPIQRIYLSDQISYSMKKSEEVEELVTLELMKLAGIAKVRGSHYSSIYQSKVDWYLGKEKRIVE